METVLNYLPAFLLFGSALYFWIFTLGLFIAFVLSDTYENGYFATFLLVGAIGITSVWSDFRIFEYINWWSLPTYLVTGLAYAGIRTYFFGRKKKAKWDAEKVEKYHSSDDAYSVKDSILRDLKEHVFRWWFLWWASIINWAITDLVRDFYNWAYDKLANQFRKIFELGLK